MLTVSLSKTAKEGASYFDKDAYYNATGLSSGWYGKGAVELGLFGPIEKEPFETILNGYGLNGKTLVKNAGSEDILNDQGEVVKRGRVAYIDLTFSASKSVSIMSYADERIEEAHNEAVAKTLEEIEKNYSFTRKVDGDKNIATTATKNLVIGRINHHESRELDPQLHSHCVLMNLTQGSDGKWRAIEGGKVFEDQLYLGQVYKNFFARELQRIGYEIEVTDRVKGSFEIKGVSKEICDEFSTRRKQILEAKKKYQDYSISEARKGEYACLDSRKSKTEASIEEIRKDVENRLEKFGESLERIKANSLNKNPENPAFLSKEDCIKLAVEEVSDKQSAFTQEDILEYALKGSIGVYTADELKMAIKETKNVHHLGEDGKYKESYYTTEDIKRAEAEIIRYAEGGKGKCEVSITHQRMKGHFDRIKAEGRNLTNGQKRAIEMICMTKDRVSLLQGDAGSGKSYAMGEVRRIMEAEGFMVRGFAPTGKATQELEKEGVAAMTVDKYLASLHHQGEVGEREVWLIDEAGMMGSRKLKGFLDHAHTKNAKVVLIGDYRQFQSIEQGKIFQDLQDHTKVAKTEITEIKRQESVYAKEVVAAIKAKDYDKAFSVLEQNDALKEIESRGERLAMIRTEYLEDHRKGVSSVVLSAINADKNEINRAIRNDLEKSGAVESGAAFTMYEKKEIDAVARNFVASYHEGEVIVFKRDCDAIKLSSRQKNGAVHSKGIEGTIKSVNGEKNLLVIQYFDKVGKEFQAVEIDLKKHSRKFQTYELVEKRFGAGDKVLFTKNDGKVNVSNGETGTIKQMDKNGNATVGIGREGRNGYREVVCNLNNRGDRGYTYLDHAYCLTNHKSQGSSFQKVIVNADVSNQKTSSNAFYVQATRMKQDITIFTNDKAKLKKQARIDEDKASTLNPVFAQHMGQQKKRSYERIMHLIELVSHRPSRDKEKSRGREIELGLSL